VANKLTLASRIRHQGQPKKVGNATGVRSYVPADDTPPPPAHSTASRAHAHSSWNKGSTPAAGVAGTLMAPQDSSWRSKSVSIVKCSQRSSGRICTLTGRTPVLLHLLLIKVLGPPTVYNTKGRSASKPGTVGAHHVIMHPTAVRSDGARVCLHTPDSARPSRGQPTC
jgi:hypothetical protein